MQGIHSPYSVLLGNRRGRNMRYAERSRHVWNIENIGFWSFPIRGPEFGIEGLEAVVFKVSLEMKENKYVTVVIKGTAGTYGCWMPLRVSVSELTPEGEEVTVTSKDVDPFCQKSTTLLELRERKWLDHLTLMILTEERLVSVPMQITREDRIPSSKEIKRSPLIFDNYCTGVRSHFTKLQMDLSGYNEFNRRGNPPPDGDIRFLSCFFPESPWSSHVRFHHSLTDSKGKIRKMGKVHSVLVHQRLNMVEEDFLPYSMISDEDRNLEENLRMEYEYSHLINSPLSTLRGSTGSTHCYRDHFVLDSVTPDILPKLKRDRWTDLNLLTDDGESFPVHRCVLVARSRYFEAMLTTNMAESVQEEIHLRGVDSSDLRHLLDFLYSGTLPGDLSVETIVDLYSLANYLEVLELCGFCLHRIMKDLPLSNVMSVGPLKLLSQCDPDLEREVQGLLAMDAEELFLSSLWIEWEEKSPEFFVLRGVY